MFPQCVVVYFSAAEETPTVLSNKHTVAGGVDSYSVVLKKLYLPDLPVFFFSVFILYFYSFQNAAVRDDMFCFGFFAGVLNFCIIFGFTVFM